MRALACAVPLSVVLLAADPSSVPSNASDGVYALAGPWACRSLDSTVSHEVATRDGEGLTVRSAATNTAGGTAAEQRFRFDAARNEWVVSETSGAFAGKAAPWTGDRWTLDVQLRNGGRARAVFELLPGGDMRRTLSRVVRGTDEIPVLAERCARGNDPPPPDACIVQAFPAVVLRDFTPDASSVPMNAPPGLVYVTVSLDADSHVTNAKIHTSTSPIFNDLALRSVRKVVFRTEIRNCKPVAAEAIYGFQF